MNHNHVGNEARIENEVRTRLQNILTSAGMGSSGVGREVLYWLPGEFVEYYRTLFLRAYRLGDQARGGSRSGDEGQVKARVSGRLKGTDRGLGQAGGGGKRYRDGVWVVRSEVSAEKLMEIDRALTGLCVGIGKVMSDGRGRVCGTCSRIMAREWKRCPFHL